MSSLEDLRRFLSKDCSVPGHTCHILHHGSVTITRIALKEGINKRTKDIIKERIKGLGEWDLVRFPNKNEIVLTKKS